LEEIRLVGNDRLLAAEISAQAQVAAGDLQIVSELMPPSPSVSTTIYTIAQIWNPKIQTFVGDPSIKIQKVVVTESTVDGDEI
jgi:hypothetical protein